MSRTDSAVALDTADKPVEAARAYEEILSKGGGDLETYLSLAVLYFQCTDFGYMSHHGLSDELCRTASRRARELLDEAEERFGPDNEISFWRYYFDHVELGEPANPSRVRAWVDQGPSRVPLFHLLMLEDDRRLAPGAKELLQEMSPPKTARERYVVSVLHSVLGEQKQDPREG